MKVYDRNFVEAYWRFKPFHNVSIATTVDYSQRVETFNTSDYTWIDSKNLAYNANEPINSELASTSFGKSEALTYSIAVNYRPNAKYNRRGETFYRANQPPNITLTYIQGVPNVFGSDIDYQFMSLEFKHQIDLNLVGRFNYRIESGYFLNKDYMEFPDFRHFMGNETAFTRFAQMSGYSIMSYYKYSTSDYYLSAYGNLEFRQFLLTNIRALRLTGTKENININYLLTPDARHYTEIGYSIDNVFRFFRIDATFAFDNGKYTEFRLQLGITSDILNFD